MSARIDGRSVEVHAGESILAAARRAGSQIPTLCWSAGLAPEGGCRICLVEEDGRLLGACHTRIEDGMQIVTASPRLHALRRGLLELQLAQRPAGAFRADPAGSEFERLLHAHGLAPGPATAPLPPPDASHPFLRFDRSRCIVCRRCLHACDEIQGQFVYGVEGRGGDARLVFGASERFSESGCVACGACVDRCPTGALADVDRAAIDTQERRIRSTCGYCGVGCQVEIRVDGERVLAIDGAQDASVNHGHLCLKGRYAHGWRGSPDRLTRPLLRTGDRFEAVSWQEAVGFAAGRLRELRERHGPQALGLLTSSRSTNEAAYLLQKLFRAVLGSNNVDCCARVCHSSTADALRLATGAGAASACYDDIEAAQRIVVAGANPTEAHPVVGTRLKQAALRGAALLVIDPRRIELADFATLHLAPRPGTNVPLFQAIARRLRDTGRLDRGYLSARCEDPEAYLRSLDAVSIESAALATGVPRAQIERAADLLAEGPALFVSGLGLSELTQGVASVLGLVNLALLTGSIGRRGAGMLPLRGQNNVQGNADLGAMPDFATGYQPLGDPGLRARLLREWGSAPPATPGLTLPEMLAAARAGRLRGLWIQGEDVAQSDPHQSAVLEALESLELLIVQEIFPTETSRRAHLVLPSAGWLEQDGSFTNAERRIQRVRAAARPPGEARPDQEAALDVAAALGAAWGRPTPAQVMDEIARVAPHLFGGISHARLEGDGLQWPCPSPDHPGTKGLHVETFMRGRARLLPIEFAPSPEHDVPGFPYTLVTGRVLEHYNVGTMTRRTANLALVGEDFLVIHPDDAAREGLHEHQRVAIESRWGATACRLRADPRVAPGTLFLSFHFPETHANRLTGPQTDPVSHCPEYKVTAVRIRAQAPPAAARPSAAHPD
ncbi:MAG: formate dehydrogenase subunit alpha [Candidatus Limnocylindria bacterium]